MPGVHLYDFEHEIHYDEAQLVVAVVVVAYMRYVWGVGGGCCGGGCCSPRRARVQNLGASVSSLVVVVGT